MRYYVTLGAREIPVEVTREPGGGWDVRVEGTRIEVDAVSWGETMSLRLDGQVVDLVIDGSFPDVRFLALQSEGSATVESERSRSTRSFRRGADAPSLGNLIAPMPGRIVRVLVLAGESVEAGAPLIVIEAMKMENELRATHAARIGSVLVKAGDTVESGAQLILFA